MSGNITKWAAGYVAALERCAQWHRNKSSMYFSEHLANDHLQSLLQESRNHGESAKEVEKWIKEIQE